MSNKDKQRYIEYTLLSIIILISLTLRLYKISNPLADWHSWRQADTVSVTREYVKNGINFLVPTFHDLSSIPSGSDNPNGYRMVEFPIVNGLTAAIYSAINPILNLELHVFSRLISILFSTGSLFFLYILVKSLSGKTEALVSALVFALLPYNIFYSRTILPEIPMVFFTLLTFWSFIIHVKKEKLQMGRYFWISSLSASLSILLKPYALFLAIPLLYLTIHEVGLKALKKKATYLYLVIVLLPFIFWRIWITQFPEGIPAFSWLLNGNNIRFKGSFFRWIFADRIGRLILGYWGLVLLSFGIIRKPKNWFFHLWLLSLVFYLTVFATGNVQHDYYQIILIPIISIFVAKGVIFLFQAPKKLHLAKIPSYSLLIVSFLFMLAFSWFEVRGYFNINHPEIVAAGEAANIILPQEAIVIAPYQGDSAFLYQINRRGWPIGGDIKSKIELGATDYVTTVENEESKMVEEKCGPALGTDQFLIINLRGCTL